MLPIAEVYFCHEIILVCNQSWRWKFLAHILCFVLRRMHFVAVCYLGMLVADIVETDWKYLDGWTEYLLVPFVKRPTNSQGSCGFLWIRSKFTTPTRVLTGKWYARVEIAVLKLTGCEQFTYQKCWAVSSSCQPLCYTYWRFCSSWQSEFQNCITETWRNILHYGGKHEHCLSSLSGTRDPLKMATICRNMSG
jgi:hypothetical protein